MTTSQLPLVVFFLKGKRGVTTGLALHGTPVKESQIERFRRSLLDDSSSADEFRADGRAQTDTQRGVCSRADGRP